MFGPQLTGVLAGRSGSGHAPLLDEAWEVAEGQFYGQLPTDQARTYGAVRGMMESFKDPYTVFVEPPQTELQSQQLSGKFGGIGASVRRENDGRIVLSPFPDRPAAQAGVKEGDVLVKIDDTPITPDMKFEEVTSLLRGEVGTPVKIEIDRAGQQLAFNITRAEISVPSVTWRILSQAPDVGYIKLNIFAQTSKDELIKAIDDLKQQGAQEIDLRSARQRRRLAGRGGRRGQPVRRRQGGQRKAARWRSSAISWRKRLARRAICRWWCWSTAARPAPRRLCPARFRTRDAACWWA